MSIGEYAFSGCSSLTSVTIPDGVTSIGSYAFSGCSSLTSVTIPDSVTSIGEDAFRDCSSLDEVHISSLEAWLSISFFNAYSNPTYYAHHLLLGDTELTDIVIPDSVTSIGDYAFRGCSSLTSITIPDSVTSIGNYAFYDCDGLTSITIPDSVTFIYSDAFTGCSAVRYAAIGSDGAKSLGKAGYSFRDEDYPKITLQYYYSDNIISSFSVIDARSEIENVVIPDGVTSIGSFAFSGCSSLMSITIPDSVTSIGAFRGCSSLTEIAVSNGNAYYTSIDGVLFSKDGMTLITFPPGRSTYAVPSGVMSIGSSAFSGCSSLTSIAVPDGVTSIGNYAFQYCSSLTSVTIPDSVTSIGSYAFSGCSSLTSITIPGSVTSIGDHAFSSCSRLTSITIFGGSIGSYAFSECGNLKSITISGSVTSIGESAFRSCSSLTSVILPDSLTSIGSYAFAYCNRLPSISLPASVTSVGDYAFNSSSFSKISIAGDSVTFGSSVFNRKPTVYCYAFTAVDEYFTNNGYTVKYLDVEGVDNVRTVTLPGGSFRMPRGRSRSIDITVFPNDDHPAVTWTSSDPAVVSVEDGTVTAQSVGTAAITASVGQASASVTVTVYEPLVSFALSPAEVWLVAKDSLQLSVADLLPADAEISLSWRSSDTGLATVDSNGLVTTKFPGEVTITATDSTDGISASSVLHLCYPVTAVSLTAPVNPMVLGQDSRLTAAVTTRDQTLENHLVTFTSSDESVITVDPDGTVHAVGEGEATVTCASQSGKTDAVTISVVVSCSDHIPEAVPAVAPTCVEEGLAEGSRCLRCGVMLVPQETIPALGHEWGEAAYTWAQDHSAVTACRVCLRDGTHVQQETVAAAAEVVLEPTCEEMGQTKYTSQAFTEPAFSVQSVTETDIPALGHEWMQVNTVWGVNFSTVTVKRVCRRDITHKVTETAQTTAAVVVAADCENNGLMSYSAVFLQPEFQDYTAEFFAEIPALGHEWGDPVYEWSPDGRAVTATRVCLRDHSHIETETANTGVTVITSPTMSDDGLAESTAPVFNNPAFSVTSQGSVVLPALGTLDLLLLPTGTQAIEEEAFAGGAFEAIIIPDGCVSIGSRAFAECENLLYVRIPAGVTDIAPDAFEECPNVVVDRSGE